jgi:dTDP-4-amino-4,6-dideoxygalactose transaminase
MTFHKLGIDLSYDSYCDWQYEYRLTPTNIWDSARAFDKDMYRVGALQCLSFGHTKRLEIGHGGAILTNNLYYYKKLKMMAYDGRDLSVFPWQDQKKFELGFHYNMRLEDARKGIIMMNRRILKDKNTQVVNYPDCSKLEINT